MNIYQVEEEFITKYQYLIGIDEAGRGPWAGPVTVGAVLLDVEKLKSIADLELLNDSKKLSPKKRNLLEEKIKEIALDYAVADISVELIDKVNILEATKLGILECLDSILEKNNIETCGIVIDGKFNNILTLIQEQAIFTNKTFDVATIIDGDALCPSIAAASILAKEHRDRLMIELHRKYPEYGFDQHKGYGTKLHMDRLAIFGPSDIHRKSFAPIKKLQ